MRVKDRITRKKEAENKKVVGTRNSLDKKVGISIKVEGKMKQLFSAMDAGRLLPTHSSHKSMGQ